MSPESVDVELMRRGKSLFFRTFADPRLRVLSDLYFYCVSFANTMYRCLDILYNAANYDSAYTEYTLNQTLLILSLRKRMSTKKINTFQSTLVC